MKGKKSKNFIIKGTVYPFDLMVSLGETEQQLKASLDKYRMTDEDIKYMSEPLPPGTNDRFYCSDDNHALIRMSTIPGTSEEFGRLQHELLHFVFEHMRRVGIQFSSKSEEAYTYLLQYVTNEVYKVLWK